MINFIQEMKMNELYHHGIQGQKWGVRNGPPYPLDDTGQNSKKNKTTTEKRKGDVFSKYVKSGKIKINDLPDYTVGSLTQFINSGQKFISGLIDGHDFDWQEVSRYANADGAERLIPPATFAKERLSESGNAGRYEFSKDDPIYERSINHGRVDDYSMRKCNPGFGERGTVQNCAKCSATLELASRGFNFAAGRQSFPSSVDSQSFWFKGASRVHMDSDISEETIKDFGKKTSGTISIRYPEGNGGHAMHWTVDDQGTFEIQDGQNGKRFGSVLDMMSEYGADKRSGVDVFRLDNCEPDWDHLASDSVVRDHEVGRSSNKVLNRFSKRLVDTW